MRCLLSFLFCLCLSLPLRAQAIGDCLLNYEIGYNYKGIHGIEGGLNLTNYNFSNKNLFEVGLYTTCEYNFQKGKSFFAPKVGLGATFMPRDVNAFCITSKCNFTYHTFDKKYDLRLTPEIGIGWMGLINIYYGYNHHLGGEENAAISRHQVSVDINISLYRLYVYAMSVEDY